jgi:hypothetical protein
MSCVNYIEQGTNMRPESSAQHRSQFSSGSIVGTMELQLASPAVFYEGRCRA